MKVKIKLKTVLVGLFITLVGLGGIAYEVFDHIEILTIEYRQFPLSGKRIIKETSYEGTKELKVNLYNYNVELVPSDTVNEVTVELNSTDYMQHYIEPVVIKQDRTELTIHSTHHNKLYRSDYILPKDLLEFTKNHLVMAKYAAITYNDELLNKNMILPTFDEHYDFTETIKIYYPQDTTFTELSVNTNGNKVYFKGDELSTEDIKNLMTIINEK